MYKAIQILSILLVAIAFAPALAHALEFPGKHRLDREAYLTVQSIYYPGFTIAGGLGEAGGLISLVVLLLITPRGTPLFGWTLLAIAGLVGMQVIFWFVTQPVNKFWLRNTHLNPLGEAFFATGAAPRSAHDTEDWRRMRDQWEYSHIWRAGLAALGLCSLLIASVL
jgi:hypothetical protein